MHELDAAVNTSITMIQEVELLSRGYNISPMPPISCVTSSSEPRRCARLRRTLRRTLDYMSKPLSEAHKDLAVNAVKIDLDKYNEIYEISRMDIEDAENVIVAGSRELEAPEALLELKIGFHRLQTLRRLLLCTLLALDYDQGTPNVSKWLAAIKNMDDLISLTTEAVIQISEANENEEAFPTPPTPQCPLTPNRERAKGNMKQLSGLSEGIRSLYAKMRLLREDAERSFSKPGTIDGLTDTLLHQYDSVGLDLKDLVQNWELGKIALTSTLKIQNQSMSPSTHRLSVPLSPSSSLGGSTAVEGSPQDALLALKGIPRSSSRSSATSNTSDEQIFEAVAAPRPRSALNRNERIAQIKEGRRKHAEDGEKAQATTHLLKELETVVDAIKDLVQDCNFDCNDSGVALQAMDNSHVALVSMMLKAESFSPFRCDRNIALGINLNSLMKVLRCAQNEDILTLKAEDAPDVVNLVFESSESDRLSEYDIKLMDIDQEHLGIPETEYSATISMPSAEFQKICRDLMALSESVAIEATKEGVKFSCSGDIGNGAVTLRSHTDVEKPERNVEIALSEPVALTFSLKYLVNFCKASGLSGTVKLCLSNEVPLLVEYALASNSYLRFYLAPKVSRAFKIESARILIQCRLEMKNEYGGWSERSTRRGQAEREQRPESWLMRKDGTLATTGYAY
ncbi:uncharacterized protein KY384_008308 [Bacidia gigantensis]|uniref:uncharacterized protein n=1 Tax=Bacidia gigantensis TaxID=2732470 RepID=UPI001D03ED88|nr:uncharacterized protein KY384_008308 [Bacidia gigantensis]KAG8526879.1 hypothetical protein KY384_008308 [Bacidia gigantensis]